MRIGIDVDGVMAEVHVPVIHLLQSYGYDVEVSDWDSWDMDILREKTGYGIGDMLELMDIVWNEKVVDLTHSEIPDMVKHLRRKLNAEIMVITKRTRSSHGAVADFLNLHVMPYDSLVFAGRGSKLEYPIDVLIDDSPNVVEEAIDYPDKTVFLVSFPWNDDVGELPDNVIRVDTILKAFYFIEKGHANFSKLNSVV